MNRKEEYEKKIQAQLNEWKIDIQKLKTKSAKAEADIKIEYLKVIEDLRKKHETLTIKLKESKKFGGEAWKDLKTGIENASEELKKALKSAISRFK